jgi:hypothetical protein
MPSLGGPPDNISPYETVCLLKSVENSEAAPLGGDSAGKSAGREGCSGVDLGIAGVDVPVNSTDVCSCCEDVLDPRTEVQADRKKPVERIIPITILVFIPTSIT